MKTKSTLLITGMSCTSCANNIEKVIKADKSVIDAEVSFVNKKAIITHEDNLDKQKLISQIKNIGYDAKFDNFVQTGSKTEFMINGMSCSSCATTIQKVAKDNPGVLFSKVDFSNKKLIIETDKNTFDFSQLQKSISEAGYELVQKGEQESKELEHLKAEERRLIIAWIITIPLTIKMLFEMIGGYIFINEDIAFYTDLIFSFIVIFIIGKPVIRATWFSIKSFNFNMDSLIGIGTISAFSTGLLNIFGIEIENFMIIGAMIMSINFIGNYLKEKATGNASQAIKQLLELGAKSAHKITESGKTVDVAVEVLKVDDIVLVKPGEKIPVDGIIIDGETTIDESIATGESIPVDKKLNDPVIGATINKLGSIKVKIQKIGKDTFLSQIVKMVEEAQGSKIPIQAFADKVTQIFVPIILSLAFLSFIFWFFFPEIGKSFLGNFESILPWIDLNRTVLSMALFSSIATLVIACPCALGLATPTALMVGMGKGAMNGILIKNGEAIQTAQKIDTVVFDKTGTITIGKPTLDNYITEIDEEQFLKIVASIENLSEHPLASAIVESVKKRNIPLETISIFKTVTGMGIEAEYNGDKIKIGNKRYFPEIEFKNPKFQQFISNYEDKGYTLVLVTRNEQLIGILGIFDEIKEDSKDAISHLHQLGIKTVMLTGDNEKSANSIAQKVNIDKVFANLLPEDKIKIVKQLQGEGATVAMVGDGINDAPALKQANVGIAIGTGTDIAIESSDITLVSGSLIGVAKAIELSKLTFKKIIQNLFWAFFYNVIAIPLALLGLLHPVIAELAMAFSSINVVGNSLRLRKVVLGKSLLKNK